MRNTAFADSGDSPTVPLDRISSVEPVVNLGGGDFREDRGVRPATWQTGYPRAKSLGVVPPSRPLHGSDNTQTQTEHKDIVWRNLTPCSVDSRKVLEMPQPQNKALTAFVRHLISEWEREGKNLRDIEVVNGHRVMAKGYASKVKTGTGVSGKSGVGFAKAFNYESYEELQIAAFTWYRTHGKQVEDRIADPEIERDPEKRKAIMMAKVLSTDLTEPLVRAVFEKYESVGVGKDAMWWLQRMNEEAPAFHAAKRNATISKKQSKADAARLKKLRERAPESSRSLPGEPPPNVVTPETAAHHRKRRASNG